MAHSRRWRLAFVLGLLNLAFGASAFAQSDPSDPAFWRSLADARGVAEQVEGENPGVAGLGEDVGAGGFSQPEAGVVVPPPGGELPPDILQEIDQRMMAMQHEWQKFKTDQAKVKYPNVVINGVFQADVGFFDQSPNNRATFGDIQDGADFRRFRISAKGAVIENVNYFVQVDFGFFGRPTFTDVWMEITHVPVLGFVKIGQWKQPYSLETVSSFRYQTFMERSVLFQTFEPFRHIGIGTYNYAEDEMTTWAASVFKTGNDQFGDDIGDNAGISVAGRMTHLPYYEAADDGSLYYLHLGGSFWHGNPSNDLFRYATIPEFFVGAFGAAAPGTSKVGVPTISNGTPPFVDTGTFPTNNFTHFGGEVCWVQGPVSVQSEASLAIVNPKGNLAQMHYKGAYTQVSYFLTGESRPYDKKAGAIDRVKPLNNFRTDTGCGWGAWELAGRWSYIDLNDGDINGGRLTDWTAGLNWYINPYTKFQLNYIKSFVANPTFGHSYANIFGARAQIDF